MNVGRSVAFPKSKGEENATIFKGALRLLFNLLSFSEIILIFALKQKTLVEWLKLNHFKIR